MKVYLVYCYGKICYTYLITPFNIDERLTNRKENNNA